MDTQNEVTNANGGRSGQAQETRQNHLTDLEIRFKNERVKERVNVKLQVEGKQLSKTFGRKEALKWEIEGLFFDTDEDVCIDIIEDHRLHKDKTLANVTVDSKEILHVINKGSCIITKEVSDVLDIVLTFDVPIELVEAARIRMADAERRIKDKTVVLESLGKARGFTEYVIGLGSIVAQLHPAASTAMKVVDFVFQRMKAQEECNVVAKELLETLSSFLPFTNMMSPKLMKLDNTKQAIAEMLGLYKKACDLVVTYSSSSVLGEMIATKQGDIEGIIDDFDKARKTFDWCTKIETWRTALAAERIGEEQLLRQLQPADKSYFDPNNLCLEGTRVSMLAKLINWALTDDEEQLFWIFGIAGSGKSAIANTIASLLDLKGFLSGCFFCKRDIPALRNPENLIPTLAYHLTRWYEPFRKATLSVLQGADRAKLDAKNLQWQFDLLIKQPLEQLQADSDSDVPPRPLLFVVDALDELGDNPTPREKLARLLAEMTSLAPWIKVLVTSRPFPEIEDGFNKSSVAYETLDINSVSAQQDIEHYTRSWITRCPRLDPIWHTDDRITALADKACELFIWASTVQKFVTDPKRRDKNRALEKVFSARSADGPQASLDALYRSVIEQIEGDADDLEYIKAVLGTITIVAKHKPLPIPALAVFLPKVFDGQTIPIDILEGIIADLRSVLFEDPALDGAVRVLHPSFLDFMGEEKRSVQFWTSTIFLDHHMATKSLRIMSKELKFNICDLETPYLANKAIENLPELIKSNISEALQYSCVYWTNHLVDAGEDAPTEPLILEFVDELLCTLKALYWFEALSFTGQLQSSIAALRSISGIYDNNSEVGKAAADLFRFVSAFYEPMSHSAPHIYISAMSWVPEKSYLADKFYPLMKSQPFAVSGKEPYWPVSLWTTKTDCSLLCNTFSPDCARIAVGASDYSIRIYDAKTGALVGDPLVGHDNQVRAVVYSPNGKHIASASFDTTIYIWDIKSSSVAGRIAGHTGPVHTVAYSPDGKYLASGSGDESIIIWDAETKEAIGEPLMVHKDGVKSVAFSPDGNYFASASYDRTICVWPFKDGEALGEPKKFIGHTSWVRAVAFFPDNKRIASCSDDMTLRVWDIESGSIIGKPMKGGHRHGMISMSISPDGSHIVTGSFDNIMCVWNVETQTRVGEPLTGHTHWVLGVAYSPDGRTIASCSDDRSLRVWSAEISQAREERRSAGHELCVNSVAYSPSGKALVSCSDDQSLRVWNALTGDGISVLNTDDKDGVKSACYSPDGKKVVFGFADSTVRIWETSSEELAVVLKGHSAAIRTVAFSRDGKLVVSASVDNTVRVWNVQTNTCEKVLTGHSSYVNAATFLPDGKRVVSGSSDNTIRIWDVDTGDVIKQYHPNVEEVRTVACSPDGTRLAYGSLDGTVSIIHLDSEEDTVTPTDGHNTQATCLCFSPDSKLLVSGSGDNTLRLWSVENGMLIGTPLTGHTLALFCVTFSPDGNFIASAATDWTIRIWNVDTSRTVKYIDKINMTMPLNINADGWVVSPNGELILWVPQEYQNGINDMCHICIPPYATGRPVRLDWSRFIKGGYTWTNIIS